MHSLIVEQETWAAAEKLLRQCGDDGRECVVYLCGPINQGSIASATAVYHPAHLGSAVNYEVPIPELSKLNSWLLGEHLSVLAQIHTHPGAAFHSATDDRWPTIETVGFLSLVIPSFCRRGLRGLPGCFLAEYLGSGRWRNVPRDEMLHRVLLKEG